MNLGSEMVKVKHVLGRNLHWSILITVSTDIFLDHLHCPWSHQLSSTVISANQAAFYNAYQYGPQDNNDTSSTYTYSKQKFKVLVYFEPYQAT